MLSLINGYDHIQRSLLFLVAGKSKTFDFESRNFFSFAFQLTLQKAQYDETGKKVKSFL